MFYRFFLYLLTFADWFKGMVELVPASDTLRKIQVEYGVTGSFKDKPLAEWLRKYNSTEEEYEKVNYIPFPNRNLWDQ